MSVKSQKIEIKGKEITIFKSGNEDYISITDIAKHKNQETTGLVISHWLSTRYTIEFMGLWEKLHNPDFNVTEFSNIKIRIMNFSPPMVTSMIFIVSLSSDIHHVRVPAIFTFRLAILFFFNFQKPKPVEFDGFRFFYPAISSMLFALYFSFEIIFSISGSMIFTSS